MTSKVGTSTTLKGLNPSMSLVLPDAEDDLLVLPDEVLGPRGTAKSQDQDQQYRSRRDPSHTLPFPYSATLAYPVAPVRRL